MCTHVHHECLIDLLRCLRDNMSSANENKERFKLGSAGNPASSHVPATAARIALFHYTTKSEEDFRIKQARGAGHGPTKKWRFWNAVNRYGQVEMRGPMQWALSLP